MHPTVLVSHAYMRSFLFLTLSRYFILWLREYELHYATWLADLGCEPPSSPSTPSFDQHCDLSYTNLIPSSPSLALFFTHTKQTFLDPDSPYALSPSAFLSLVTSTHSLAPSIPHFSMPADHDNMAGLHEMGGTILHMHDGKMLLLVP